MKEELVSFETAKLLKEKGFVNLSDKSYIISEGARYGLLSNFTNKYNNSVETGRVEAPTQSLAQKWLREKHNIHVEIYKIPVTNEGNMYGCYVCRWIDRVQSNSVYESYFKTYEEALEEGLKEGLNLIK